MEVLSLQLIFMSAIFACTTVIGMTPILLGRVFSRKFSISPETKARLLSDASCFAAGVFLFVCFLGLLPAADRKFHVILESLENSNSRWEAFAEFPWGFFVVTCGFLVIFTIDKVVHTMDHSKSKAPRDDLTSFRSLIPSSTGASNSPQQRGEDDPSSLKNLYLNYECHLEACGVFEEGNNHSGVPSSFMFLVALGIHSVFEGIAVGLQTSRDKIMEYSVAVLLHEAVMALTFGLEVSKSPTLKRGYKLLYVLIFTLSIPLGITIGIVLQNAPSTNRELISAVIEAFATGIFIHVIFIEILATEFPHLQFDRHKCRLSTSTTLKTEVKFKSDLCLLMEKIASICIGFTLLIVINVFLHGHSH